MADIVKVGEDTIKFRYGATGFSVEHSGAKRCQVFWHSNEEVARAYFDGYVHGMQALSLET